MEALDLKREIEALFESNGFNNERGRSLFEIFLANLREGKIRAAERSDDGCWRAVEWVKKGILLGFRMGKLVEASQKNETLQFFDKDTYPLRPLTLDDGVRIVPGGSSVRDGAYVAKGVVIMPPAYVNVGAYVDEGVMIDSHALVGSCAQIGRRVHLSAAVQVGGVLEPIGANPVIIEDECFIGGGSGIYEGTIVRSRAVIASGVILTRSTPIYDLVNQTVIRSSKDKPLEVPENAVVVQGARQVAGEFALKHGISVYCPVIIKYRDEKTEASALLEDALR
jgi:2,3,4,5-tetrahydropyridine-2-carboxylate N-succinyltransferase